MSRRTTTHFVRDSQGNVIDVIRTPVEQSRNEERLLGFGKKLKGFVEKETVDFGQKLVASGRQLKEDFHKRRNPSVDDLKKQIEMLKKQQQLLKLQREKELLFALQSPHHGIIHELFFGEKPPFMPPGYHIEKKKPKMPVLPPGYRWVKNKNAKK